MATYYWVGGTGNWNTTSTTNWSLTSGGAGGAGVPTTADDVIFDANSDVGGATATVTAGSGASCKDLIATGTNATIKITGTLSVYGNSSFTSSPNFYIDYYNGYVYYFGTGTHTVSQTGSSTFGNTIFSGTGSYTFVGTITGYILTHNNGTLNFGSSTSTWSSFNISGSNVRTTNLNTTTLALGLANNPFNVTGSNYTFNAGTSTFNFTFPAVQVYTPTLSYYNVGFTSTLNNGAYVFEAASCNNLTIAAQTDPTKARSLTFSTTTPLVINGTLALNGSAAVNSRCRVEYGNVTVNAVTGLSNIDFLNCTFSGPATPLSGTNLGDGGGNTGITGFAAGRNIYWVGGTGNVTDTTRYASTSGGGGSSANFPLPQDTLIFDNNSGAAGSSITTNGAYLYKNINASSRTNTLGLNIDRVPYLWGDFIGAPVITTGGSPIYCIGTANQTFSQNGGTHRSSIAVVKPAGGTLSLGSNYINTSTNVLNDGISVTGNFSSNNYAITAPTFTTLATVPANVNLGTSTINITGGEITLAANTVLAPGATFNLTLNAAVTRTLSLGTRSEATSPNINITAGTSTTSITGTVNNLSTVGFTGTASGSHTIYGNATFGTGSAMSGTKTFAATSGIKTITTNGVSVTSFTFNGVGGQWQLQDNLTALGTLTLTNGVLDLNSKTVNFATFTSSGITTARALLFGASGVLNITTTSGGTVFTTSTSTNLTMTGSKDVRITGNATGVTRTITLGSLSESNAPNIKVTAGTDAITLTGNMGDLDFTGFAGALNSGSRTIYGNLTLSTGMTLGASGANSTIFAATSGTKTITTNGKIIDFPITFNGIGGTWQLTDPLTMNLYGVSLLAGTLNLNNQNATLTTFASTGSSTRALNFGTSTITITGSGASAWSVTTPTVTYSPGAKISMTSASAKTFAGGGLSYPTLEQAGTGTLTISGNNTFANITNTVQPTTVTFASGTTQTFAAFNLRGTAGNLVTLAPSSTSNYALSAPNGVLVDVDYLSISRSTATGGAAWYAGINSTNGGNNTGWIFTASPVIAFATGVTATAAVGSVTVGQGVGAFPTTVTGTGATGTLAITGTGNVTPTGVVGTMALGTAVAEVAFNVSGVQATAQLNSVILFTNNFITVNGVQGTTQLGQEAATISIVASPTGVQASALVNSVSSVLGSAVVSASKVTGTSAVGFVSIDADGGVGVVGNVGTAVLGNETVAAGANVYPTGVSAQVYLGTSSETGSTNVSTTGVFATGQTGTVTTTTVNIFSVTGVLGTGNVGTVNLRADQILSVSGVYGTTFLGTANTFNVTNVNLTTVYADGYVGNITQTGTGEVYPLGVQGNTILGETAVWITVNDAQTNNWNTVQTLQI